MLCVYVANHIMVLCQHPILSYRVYILCCADSAVSNMMSRLFPGERVESESKTNHVNEWEDNSSRLG